jgi:hypothetical protein
VSASISVSLQIDIDCCNIDKIYNNHFVSKKFVLCQNFDGFDKKHSHGLFSMYIRFTQSPDLNILTGFYPPNILVFCQDYTGFDMKHSYGLFSKTI